MHCRCQLRPLDPVYVQAVPVGSILIGCRPRTDIRALETTILNAVSDAECDMVDEGRIVAAVRIQAQKGQGVRPGRRCEVVGRERGVARTAW